MLVYIITAFNFQELLDAERIQRLSVSKRSPNFQEAPVGYRELIVSLYRASPFRYIIKELLHGFARTPFCSKPSPLFDSAHFRKQHAIKIFRTFTFKLCPNLESVIGRLDRTLVSNHGFKHGLDRRGIVTADFS